MSGRIGLYLAALTFTVTLLSLSANGQSQNQFLADNTPRAALVFGNNAYEETPLKNPVNDATGIAEALRACGFDTTLKTNAGLRAMEEAIDAFGERIHQNGIALFYYAGHGIQSEGKNYLVPVDAMLKAEKDARYTCVDADRVLVRMETAQAAVNIVILDACRNNPFSRGSRNFQRGLAQMEAVSGTLLAFATAPGNTASDGTGNHGVYTEKLLHWMRQPGLPVEMMFKRVRQDVMGATNNEQVPWENSSLVGEFCFVPSAEGTMYPSPAPGIVAVPPATPVSAHEPASIKASSALSGYPAENALDDDADTSWKATSARGYLEIRFGEERTIKDIRFETATNNVGGGVPQNFTIELCRNGEWSEVHKQYGNMKAQFKVLLDNPVTCSGFRIRVEKTISDSLPLSIAEITVR